MFCVSDCIRDGIGIGERFGLIKLGAVMFSVIFSLCGADNREIGLG
jgi:hypothetical protein